MSNRPVLNPESIAALQAVSPDDGGEFLNELIDIFLADTPARLDEITVALSQRDAPTLTRAAHSIKGSAGNFGATLLAQVSLEIEQAGKVADFPTAEKHVAALQAAFAETKAALAALRQG